MSDNRIVPKTNVDWAHWEAASENDWLSIRCPFCPCLRDDIWGRSMDPGPRERNLVFHFRRHNFQDGAELCLFCQHLNPGQLFGFFRHERIVQYHSVYIVLGTLAELEARRQCGFCYIVLCTVRAHAAAYRINEHQICGDGPIAISLGRYQKFSIHLSFGKGLRTSIATTKALPTHPDSIPEENQVVGNSISWNRVRQWIDLCSTQHTECSPTVISPSGMRLIDVRERKITTELDPGHGHAFVALSYVWGKNIDSKRCVLLKENTTQLEQAKSLENLPKTIEDAITICKNLGQRFLWVDRLCIVQNDEAKKGHQIHAMADIFQSAALTLIATSGESMESPIPGISTKRQTFQSRTHISFLQITSGLPQLSWALHAAPWTKRGWTYQESILSSRKLFFTDLEVWFTCSDDFHREDVSLKGIDLRNIRGDAIHMTKLQKRRYIGGVGGRVDVMKDYWRHLEEYTKRSLTYQSDIYNAFTGVLTALFGEDKTVYGLPELYLDKALLWRLGEDTSTWDIRDCTVVEQHVLCPSWAWSSINGAVRNGEDISCGTYLASLVSWSLVDEDGMVKEVNVNFEGIYGFRKSLAFAWRGGCFEAPLPNDLQEKLEPERDSLSEWVLEQRWPTQKEFWNEVRSRRSPDTEVSLTTFSHLRPGMLLTRTQTAVLRLGACQKCLSFEYFEILNQHGNMIGAIEANELRLKSNGEGTERLEQTNYELMALSLSEAPSNFESIGEWNDIRDFLDREGNVVLLSITVKILLISWDKNATIARRVSMGWVYLKAWVETERTWKTVVLE